MGDIETARIDTGLAIIITIINNTFKSIRDCRRIFEPDSKFVNFIKID